MNTPDKEKLKAEVDANFAAFNKISFKESDTGKFALLRKGKLVKICDAHSECLILGNEKFADRLYSVQGIGYYPKEDLGFMGSVFLR